MSDSQSSNSLGLGGVLGVVFIVLKLTNYIHWPWLWVLAPLWVAPAILVVLAVGYIVFHITKLIFEGKK